ncbi:MAG: hypothetical protein K6C30_04430 [Bacteroidaceae bacterium]|nr:hypothetical protein [Bacteroidaceae bacterium]
MKKLIILLFLAIAGPVMGASVIRQAKEAIKKKQNLENTAKKLIEEAAKSETKHADKIECYVLAAECWKRVNEAENMKLYLKQKYDTVKFYSSIQQMYTLLEKADSLEQQPDEKGRVRIKHRRSSHDMLLPYRRNLFVGGNWYFRKAQFTESISLFRTFVDAAESPVFENDNLLETDTLMPHVGYLTVNAAYLTKDYDAIVHYTPLALRSNIQNASIQEYYAKALASKGDTTKHLAAMWDGLHTYPEHTFFYSHLMDHLIENKEYELGVSVTDSMIAWCDTIPLFHYARSLLMLKMNRDEEAIKDCDACLALDSNYVDAYYNKGVASLNLAVIYTESACTDINNPQCKRDLEIIRSLYQLARLPMERVRQLQPDRQDRWAPALYRIYLHLNMGKEFDEIDDILDNL